MPKLLKDGVKNKREANGSPAAHQTLRQQGGTGEDSHIHLADWTLSVAAIEKKKNKNKKKKKNKKTGWCAYGYHPALV